MVWNGDGHEALGTALRRGLKECVGNKDPVPSTETEERGAVQPKGSCSHTATAQMLCQQEILGSGHRKGSAQVQHIPWAAVSPVSHQKNTVATEMCLFQAAKPNLLPQLSPVGAECRSLERTFPSRTQ